MRPKLEFDDFRKADGAIDYEAYSRAKDVAENLNLADGLEALARFIRDTPELPRLNGTAAFTVFLPNREEISKGGVRLTTTHTREDFEALRSLICASRLVLDSGGARDARVSAYNDFGTRDPDQGSAWHSPVQVSVSIEAEHMCVKESTTCEKWALPEAKS